MAQPGFISTGIYSSLPDFAFDAVRVPIRDIQVKLGSRFKMHKFPRVDAGLLEKLGREPIEVSGLIPFHASFKKWPGLFSDTLPKMRQYFLKQTTAQLVVPHLGAFDAMITAWNERTKGVSGVEVEVTWTEDLSDNFRFAALTERYVRAVSTSGYNFVQMLPSLQDRVSPQDYNITLDNGQKPGDVFAAMRSIVSAIDSIGDQADLYSSFYTAKLNDLATMCGLLDRAFPPYNDPNFARDLEILHQLWSDTNIAKANANAQLPEIDMYLVPRTMSCGELARELYQDASRGSDILGLNPMIEDPFRVPLGLEIRYFRAAA